MAKTATKPQKPVVDENEALFNNLSAKVSIVEVPSASKFGKISIKPFFEEEKENMGLQEHGLVLFDGVAHEEPLACLELNGTRRYVTGLNPYAPEIKNIKDPVLKAAKIKAINALVAQLEAELAQNILDPEDPDFWKHVKLLRPDNDSFWSQISIRCTNETMYLDVERSAFDLIKMLAIEAGGFSTIGRSWEWCKAQAVAPKFYLDKEINTVAVKTEVKKLTNRAISLLDDLFAKNTSKLMYVCKVVDAQSTQYKKSTPVDIMYDNMDNFIKGQSFEKNMKRAAEVFTAAAESDIETLQMRSLIKDGNTLKQIAPKSDGFIYHMATNIKMGRTVSDCVEFLKNPANDDTLGSLLRAIEPEWNK